MAHHLERLKTALASRYAIQEELGTGGMATVYLAEDLKHHRKVAVKVLRPELAAILGGERFLKEIEVTAHLQHPHILPLYDSGEADAFLYYVMPYVEGESLRDKLNREKQLGVDETVEIAKAVATALDYAHRQGVIHRDIKPENILFEDGQPVVADFGIALAVTTAGGTRLTETGLSLGTPQYMSPEQAAGDRQVTPKSDIYSLGAVVYEMLVGDPPHTGNTVQAIIAKVTSTEPQPIADVRHTVPHNVQGAVLKALEKVAADRFDRATEFSEALANPSFIRSPIQSAGSIDPFNPGRWNRLSVAFAGLAASLAIVAVWALLPAERLPAPRPVRFHVIASGQLVAEVGTELTFAPDGSRFAYVGHIEGVPQLFMRVLDDLSAKPIHGTQGATQPFFSDDGQWLGFKVGDELRKVLASGGPPVFLAETPTLAGASWGTDDVIVYGSFTGGLMRIGAAGGTPEPVTTLDTTVGETGHRWPEVLPGGRGVVFTTWTRDLEDASLSVASLESGETTRLSAIGTNPHYTTTGHLVYVRSDGSVVAAAFDADNGELIGQSVPLLEGVNVGNGGPAELALSRSGSLVYTLAEGTINNLVLVDRQGNVVQLDPRAEAFRAPQFSPGGDRVAFHVDRNIWVYDVDQKTLMPRTFEGANDAYPNWSADGTRIIFKSDVTGTPSLHTVAANGSGEPEFFLGGEIGIYENATTPDGKWLAVRLGGGGGFNRDILVSSLEGDRALRPYAATRFDEKMLDLSPGGEWLAYVSDRSGRDEVYVQSFPEPGALVAISVEGGIEPRWGPDGHELFYRSPTNVMVAKLETEPTIMVKERAALFEDRYSRRESYVANYDVDPRSGALLMLRSVTGPERMVVTLNWFEELKAKVGT